MSAHKIERFSPGRPFSKMFLKQNIHLDTCRFEIDKFRNYTQPSDYVNANCKIVCHNRMNIHDIFYWRKLPNDQFRILDLTSTNTTLRIIMTKFLEMR